MDPVCTAPAVGAQRRCHGAEAGAGRSVLSGCKGECGLVRRCVTKRPRGPAETSSCGSAKCEGQGAGAQSHGCGAQTSASCAHSEDAACGLLS